MKTLGIIGSARKAGNTARLVEQILAGASQAGSQVERLDLIDHDIRPCLGCPCYVQSPKRPCVQSDDLAGLGVQMAAADLLVVSTPIYWYGPSGLFKLFLDRWIGLPAGTFTATHVAAALTMQDATLSTAQPTLDMLDRSFHGDWISYEGHVLASGLGHTPDAIASDPECLKRAFRFGLELAGKLLGNFDAGSETETPND